MTAIRPNRPNRPTRSLRPAPRLPSPSDRGGEGLDRPIRLEDLAAGERALVRAFRCWVAPDARENAAWNEFAVLFGGRLGKPVMGGFVRLVERVRAGARRQVLHHTPCCPCLAADEMRLVNLVGAAAVGRLDLAQALAADLLATDAGGADRGAQDALALAESARVLAQAMAVRGAAPALRLGVRYSLKAEETPWNGPRH